MPFGLTPELIALSFQIVKSYNKRSGKVLIDSSLNPLDIAKQLYHYPVPVLAHNSFLQNDPVFTYCNIAAQKVFGYQWDEFIGLQSKLSAPTELQQQRKDFIDQQRTVGFSEAYEGIRVNKQGQLFQIKDTSLWTVDAEGQPIGQAALLSKVIHDFKQ
ncbi:MEKHLA domain-containing protein [Globomyces pollinis-pini]|nr:MEKHLA domain-containing protein [Globomyces pollinis-pini]